MTVADAPRNYRIVVAGQVPHRWSVHLNGLTLLQQEATTVLTGARSVQEVEANVHSAERGPLSADALDAIQEIADMVLFLASDKADYITGSEFVVDGGVLLRPYSI